MTPQISLSDALLENERLRLQVARLTDENALSRRQLAEYQVHPASVFASVQQVTNELEEPDTLSPFFDGKSFATTFRKDISQARRSVIIACPNIRLQSHSPYHRLFSELSARGVEVAVYVKDDDIDNCSLAASGIRIISVPILSCRCAIIDRKLIWYGSINYLGRNALDDNAMRFEDPSLAADLLNIVCQE